MEDGILVSLGVGLKKSQLPDDFDMEKAGLEMLSSGVEGDEETPYTEFVGLSTRTGYLMAVRGEETDLYFELDALEKTFREAQEKFGKVGVRKKVKLYIMQGISW